MRELIEQLCGPECAGRAAGTRGGDIARGIVVQAFRDAGLDPHEQPLAGCGGANVLAKIGGDVDRHVLVGAHFDHLGTFGKDVYHGADDNAAAVAVLVAVGQALAAERDGRGVILAAFDAEEPPHFLTSAMGSREFVRANRDPIDFMICMDLVAERSRGTYDLLASLKRAEPGVIVRPADAEIVPPLSDYEAFWRQQIPFLFLSAGRSRVYHTPEDTPDKLDLDKIAATARWLTRFVRAARVRDPAPFVQASLDRATLDELAEILEALLPLSPEAAIALHRAQQLRTACDRSGNLPDKLRGELSLLILMLEDRLQ
jgi:Iap family predicted aminopeptidase